MGKFTLLIIILSLFLIVGVLQGCSKKEISCDKPYIKVWSSIGNNCCLDLNKDNVCDTAIGISSSDLVTYKIGDIEKSLEQISNEKIASREEQNRYDVKKAVWDKEKENKNKAQEIEEEMQW